jgi:CcmD family protein
MVTGNWAFITAAYMAAWIGVVGYWIFVHRALRRARKRYEQSVAAPVRAEGDAG